MTKAKITAKEGFRCAPDGHTIITIPFGTEVDGQIAKWALDAHKASRMFDPRTDTQAMSAAPETKDAPKRRGRKKGGK